VREIVIVIADLYLPDGAGSAASSASGSRRADAVALAGLDHLARFCRRLNLRRGWRHWLADWLGRRDVADWPVARVAAAVCEAVEQTGASHWMATPVHFTAGMSTLHFDPRGILRLQAAEAEALARDFERTFRDPQLQLRALDSGDLILLQPAIGGVSTTEPARIARAGIAAALPTGEGASALRRLGSELEMWLHEHPLNVARAHRGDPTISTLWLWGGASSGSREDALPLTQSPTGEAPSLAFGLDPFLRGLWTLQGSELQPLTQEPGAPFSYPAGRSSVVVLEAGDVLRRNVGFSLADALAELDRRFIVPAIGAVRRGEVEKLSVLVNDRLLALTRGAQRKFWRRRRNGLESLQ